MSLYHSHIQVRNRAVLVYDVYYGKASRALTDWRRRNMKRQRAAAYSGLMTPGATKRLRKACCIMAQSCPPKTIYNEVTQRYHRHQFSFITLTLAENDRMLSAREAYDTLLVHFLQWLRRTMGVHTYIWKAELQERGQIHYHITCPNFLHMRKIQFKWNDLQRRAGLLESFKLKHGHDNPPSTQIKTARSVDDMAAYLEKEICKSMQNQEALDGKVWDCSQNLKEAKYFTLEMGNYQERFLELCVQNGHAEALTGDRFTLYRFQEPPEEYVLTREQYAQFRDYLTVIRSRRDPHDDQSPGTDPPTRKSRKKTLGLQLN